MKPDGDGAGAGAWRHPALLGGLIDGYSIAA
jgi:hypothetical protein